MRIRVEWLNGTAWAFYDTPKDAHEQVASLKMAGFSDARVDWSQSWQNPPFR